MVCTPPISLPIRASAWALPSLLPGGTFLPMRPAPIHLGGAGPAGGRPASLAATDQPNADAAAAARRALAATFGGPAERGFAIRLWDGTVDGPPSNASPFTLVIRRPGALRRAL